MSKPTMEELFDTLPDIPEGFREQCMDRYCEPTPIYYKRKGRYADCICGKCGKPFLREEKPVRFVKTQLGEIEKDEWIRKATEEIHEEGLDELFEKVKEYCRRYPWLKKEKDLTEWALSCIYYKSYMYWPDFEIIWG